MLPATTVTEERQGDMGSQTELSHAAASDNADRFTAPASPPAGAFPDIAAQCDEACRRVLERMKEADTAGKDYQAAQLDWESQVLWWKARRALDPDCAAPEVILESFDDYPAHPALPAACRAGAEKGARYVWDHVLEGPDGVTIGEQIRRRAARMRQVQIGILAATKADRLDEVRRLEKEAKELRLKRSEPRILHGFTGKNDVGDEIGEVQRRLRSAREAGQVEEIRRLEEEEQLLWQKLDKVCSTPGDIVDALYQITDPASYKALPPDYRLPFDPVTGRSKPDPR